MNPVPTIEASCLATVTTPQMIEVDRLMIEQYGIDLTQMMENAGRNLARLSVERFLNGEPANRRILVLAGRGGNGGGAIVAARRLHSWGANVELFTSSRMQEYAGVPRHQLEIADELGIPQHASELPSSDYELILDGLIGYSLRGTPRGRAAELISFANNSESPTLSLDVPSGIDTATGEIHTPSISAAATLTLALPKSGLYSSAAARCVGELYVGDISVPPALYKRLKLDVPSSLFATSDVVRVLNTSAAKL